MLTYVIGAVVVVVVLAVGYHFLPENIKQLLRIRGKDAVKKGSTGSERAADAVAQAEAKLPEQRKRVARMMTAAQRAQENAKEKRAEVDGLLDSITLAQTSNGSEKLLTDLKIKWKTAKDSIPVLDGLAAAAHKEAEDAQALLDEYLTTIQTSREAVARISANEDMTALLRESAAFKQQSADLKKGLGSLGKELKESEDELSNAKNENDLANGSTTDRELEELKRKQKAKTADEELAEALANRNKK